MRTYLIIASLFVHLSAFAQEKAGCGSYGKLAETLMESRQIGMSMQKQMESAEKQSEPLRSQVQSMLIMAYERPRYNSEENQRREIENFRDQIYLECIKFKKTLQTDK